MYYKNVVSGIFIDRPNRFLAHVKINKKIEIVHVRNSGRCKEILIPGTKVYLEKVAKSKKRKTQYSLISAYKNSCLINIDSQIPNLLVTNAIQNKDILQINPLLKLKR
ncbi:MAG: DNA/RNA nuclease SfsA, partial [Atribacterota bacterium]|nr:DNA/RNA nuclease SfsA [Atribacterota bacterium]